MMTLNVRSFGARRAVIAAVLAWGALLLTSIVPAQAEVRLGKNVRIGGHDFSNQTYNSKRRGVINLYEGKPRNPGCVWKADGRGGKVKVCHLQRVR
ncbi:MULTISPECIES: hypothetical protein [unclassified Chelatococcus]|uniref:hypothetical protein n=1 Tax=unclassified Chelatococcus TaxID=2638111 RepID=UPI0020BE16D1|nr:MULTISPECIES: hypothetical protein [unclassified Chelatococcus]MCO5077613.1 hypothetical protein [Chelatococcus sp.]CAH1667562.1 conserved hypothetical protein [Hyphomicrobiales bacterium]CAH1679626.1 conserved hypothetical protein [Hyphomicrobiales bacterium]